jgi:hypothetical protein
MGIGSGSDAVGAYIGHLRVHMLASAEVISTCFDLTQKAKTAFQAAGKVRETQEKDEPALRRTALRKAQEFAHTVPSPRKAPSAGEEAGGLEGLVEAGAEETAVGDTPGGEQGWTYTSRDIEAAPSALSSVPLYGEDSWEEEAVVAPPPPQEDFKRHLLQVCAAPFVIRISELLF